jgi:hypothetical protein
MDDRLPPEFQRTAELVDQQPPEVREVFHFMLTVAMEESGMAELINTAQVDGRTWYSYDSVAGDVFSVVRPEIDPELEREMREMREALQAVLQGRTAGSSPTG